MSKNPVPRGQPIQLTNWSCRKIRFEGVNQMNMITVDSETLKRMIAQAVEAEREACAKLCDALHYEVDAYGAQCAAAIRARGNT
jgi:hypothetical protein